MRKAILISGGAMCLATAIAAMGGGVSEPACCEPSAISTFGGPTTAPAATSDAPAAKPDAPAGKIDAHAAFDQLAKLVGAWKEAPDAAPGMKGSVEFKVTSGGSVLMETMMPGSAYEMVNMYAVDGDDLLVTHYCASGNQPRMKLTEAADGKLTFTFKDATNLASPDDEYMGTLKMTITDGKLVEDWTSFEKGKPAGGIKIDLVKK